MLALGEELVGGAGVAEVEEGLAAVDGEVGLRHPCAPGAPVGAGAVEDVFGGVEGAAGGSTGASSATWPASHTSSLGGDG